MDPRGLDESWADWTARSSSPERAKHCAQKSISREDVLAVLVTPESFIAWLRRQRPETEIAAIYDPTNDMLAEYLWVELGVFAAAADSIVWLAALPEEDSYIEWDDLPVWVQALNHVEARRTKTVPDDKLTWTASEALTMVREAVGADQDESGF